MTHWVHMTSEPGELIFDPFLGSGTTAVAAVGAGRRFVGGDIEAGNVVTARGRLGQVSHEDAKSVPRSEHT